MDHIVKLKEVPKGQKLQYIWDYWRVPGLLILIGLFVVISLGKTIFFPEKIHMEVLFTCRYDINDEQKNEMTKDLKDFYIANEDDNYKITYVRNNVEIADLQPEVYAADLSKLIVEITSASAYVLLADEDMFDALVADGLVSTYKEVGIDSDEYIKISADKVFKNDIYKGKFYFTLRPREVSQLYDDKALENYEYSVNYIKKLIEAN